MHEGGWGLLRDRGVLLEEGAVCMQMWHLSVSVSVIHAQGHRASSLQGTQKGSGTLRVHLQQALPCAEPTHPHTPPLLALHAPLCCPLKGLPASLLHLLLLLPHLEWLYLEASACHLVALSLEWGDPHWVG